MSLPNYQYQRPDYSSRVGNTLGSVADTFDAQSEADPLTKHALLRIINGDNPIEVAHDTKIAQYLHSIGVDPSNHVSVPNGFGRPPNRDNSGITSLNNPAIPEPGMNLEPEYATPEISIKNKDVPNLMKLGGMLSSERNRESMLGLKDSNLTLGYDRLNANIRLGRDRLDWQKSKGDAAAEYRDAMTQYINAKRDNMPQEMANAMQRLDIAKSNLGLRGQEVNLAGQQLVFQENTKYMDKAGESLQTAAALDQLVKEGYSMPGIQTPSSDYQAQRAAEIYDKLPIFGSALAAYTKNKASENLTQAQRDFKRNRIMALADYVHAHYGSQLTSGEMTLANAISGDQLSFADSMAGLQALAKSLRTKVGMWNQALPDAASRISPPTSPLPSPGEQSNPGGPVPGRLPGMRIESLTPEQRRQYGVNSQKDLDYINESMGRSSVGGPENSGGLDMMNDYGYGYKGGP